MDFGCVKDCSQCCVEREYYPSKEFGKIGVLVLPEEIERINHIARDRNIRISILPRLGVSDVGEHRPTEIIAYQMMGVEENGNTCPFLDTSSPNRSPHGGHVCRIYDERPLACMAYPLNESEPIMLDEKCKFCKECGQADGNLDSETEALLKIKSAMRFSMPQVWRYATGVGEKSDMGRIRHGWIPE